MYKRQVKDISRREKQLVDGFKSMLGLAVHVQDVYKRQQYDKAIGFNG